MPEMDGVDLAERDPGRSGRHVTYPADPRSSVGARERASAADRRLLSKPVKPSALHDALVTALGERGDRPSPVRSRRRRAVDATRWAERHPLRILLAEDNPVNQKLALRLLGKLGYEADVAGDGLQAIAALERLRPTTWS